MESRKFNSFLPVLFCILFLLITCQFIRSQPVPISSFYNDSTQQIVVIEFNENITVAPDNAGWTINVNASPVPIMGPPAGMGTNVLVFQIAAPIVFGDMVTVSFNDLLGSTAGRPETLENIFGILVTGLFLKLKIRFTHISMVVFTLFV
jgi:hypothetical protein